MLLLTAVPLGIKLAIDYISPCFSKDAQESEEKGVAPTPPKNQNPEFLDYICRAINFVAQSREVSFASPSNAAIERPKGIDFRLSQLTCALSTIDRAAALEYQNLVAELVGIFEQKRGEFEKSGVLRIEAYRIIIIDTEKLGGLSELSYLSSFPQTQRQMEQLRSSSGPLATSKVGYFRNGQFHPGEASRIPRAELATVIIVNLRRISSSGFLMLNNLVAHELSHFADQKTGLFESSRREIDPTYEYLKSQRNLGGNPLIEISPRLNQIELALNSIDDPSLKKRMVTWLVVSLAFFLWGLKEVPKLLVGETRQKYESFAAELLCLEAERIKSLNVRLAEIGAPVIDINITETGRQALLQAHQSTVAEIESLLK